jgi:hypothetical protein
MALCDRTRATAFGLSIVICGCFGHGSSGSDGHSENGWIPDHSELTLDRRCDGIFRLCAAFIANVDLEEPASDGGQRDIVVAVALTKDASSSFETFTRTWLKRNACITVDSEILTVAKVQYVTPSTASVVIGGTRKTRLEAQVLVDKLRKAPVIPCGS